MRMHASFYFCLKRLIYKLLGTMMKKNPLLGTTMKKKKSISFCFILMFYCGCSTKSWSERMSPWWSLCTLYSSHPGWSYRRQLESLLLWACVQCHVWRQLFERNDFPLFVDLRALEDVILPLEVEQNDLIHVKLTVLCRSVDTAQLPSSPSACDLSQTQNLPLIIRERDIEYQVCCLLGSLIHCGCRCLFEFEKLCLSWTQSHCFCYITVVLSKRTTMYG